MNFTKAYNNIQSITGNKNISLLDKFNYHNGLVETYISNELEEQNTNNLKIYIIVTSSDKSSESLKSITTVQRGNNYFIHGYWPEQSFLNVFKTISTDNKITPFLEYWIERMQNINIVNLKDVDISYIHNRIKSVSIKNNMGISKDAAKIYPYSLRKRAFRKDNNKRDSIRPAQQKKIKDHFGYEGLSILESSIFTVRFTDDPLKQKTINLLDLPRS
ncbi:hypothetical protein G7084_04405 [Weissella coleopterorum]|uniref:Uncharacterized protein n=1 Tax=Weissella coleopterorum TaxID=2714949 RepID=A0A6G8AZY0_9LACO|nr:hypothetical protein [Weissella coleopterorum]QIL50618.1 hypothetical protein G7084_04405 [Weissella coleopterorum]